MVQILLSMSGVTGCTSLRPIREAKIQNVLAALQDTWDAINDFELAGRKRVLELEIPPSDELLLRSFAVIVEIYFKKLETELLIDFPDTTVVADIHDYFNNDNIELIDAENSDAFMFPVFQPLSGQNLEIYDGIVKGAREAMFDLMNTKNEAGIADMRKELLETLINGDLVSEWVDAFISSQPLAERQESD
ncbi:hypothetical protein Vi05172_g2924 [Venturia inaequalis]|uniref:Uncharacterized protein n=1 Tax=Venturia inaequalis TaxID=5025 RepID=A0A8H3UQG3_VENIN|nr:hypothetical protein EG327_009018 [Venturia inaequalis]RDI87091.1 hypothetical protein Vi05172_g2924 [Venturia inaequalis]